MVQSERLKDEIREWNGKTEGKGEAARFEILHSVFWSWFKHLPDDLLSGLFTVFLDKYRKDASAGHESSLSWLGSIGSVLLEDWDGTDFPPEEWVELREIVADNAGELDVEFLTYAMNLVMEHKALG